MEGGELVISGEQGLVLSASDAAQLLAQAGIQLSESDQVIIGGGGGGGEVLTTEEAQVVPGVVDECTEAPGEILYIDPNDPQAAALLAQAGLALGPDGTVQAIESLKEANMMPLETSNSNLVHAVTAGNQHLVEPEKPTALLEAQKQILAEEVLLPTTRAGPHINEDIKPILEPTPPPPPVPVHQPLPVHQPPPVRPKKEPRRSAPPSQQVVQVGPDQQQVMYSVTSEDGKTQQYMMLCPKEMDQQTLIRTLVKQITSDPNNRGRKTIRITKQKSSTANVKGGKAKGARNNSQQSQARRAVQQKQSQPPPQQLTPQPQQRVLSQPGEPDLLDSALMAIENTKEDFLSAAAASSTVDPAGSNTAETATDPSSTRVFVRCNYCNDFRTILNSETWESILNHILPVAKEELHTTFYGDLSKHFVRTLRIQVNGRQIVKTGNLLIPQCEVILTHSLICLKTKKEFLLDRPTASFVADLAKHIKNTQFGTNRSNSLLCVFCNSPYTYEDYIRHVTPHQDAILATLNCFAGAYCASSYEAMMKYLDPSQNSVCNICQEVEQADLRFQPCTKFSTEYNCNKKLQFAIDCFSEKYGDNGFMRLNTSSVTRCSVCKNSQNVYCAVFHISTTVLSEETQEVHDLDSQLCVCINCQKQFINIVMKEQDFEKKLKLFQLKNMEQLCSCLRVILNQASPLCQQKNALIYTVQENLSNPSASIHSVRTADVAEVMPITKLLGLSETEITTSRIKASYQCDLCGFFIDLTSLISNPNQTQKNDMILGVVLEHMVPHTESLIGVITSSAANQTFNLKFEVVGRVSEAAGVRKIHLSLQRKFKSANSNMEIPLDKDEEKTMSQIRAGVKSERKNYVAVRSSISSNNKVLNKLESSANQLIEVNKFIERQRGKFSLLAQCGCNTTLLGLYAECRLCSKFSYPDFRLCGVLSSVDLCENCVDTVLTLCLPTEPEILDTPETCLLLGEERPAGHRLVLSNNIKKWLSLDGVNLIKKTLDDYEEAKLFDTSALLLSSLRKHLVAALRKCWLDSSVMTVAAGFCVTDAFLSSNPELNAKKPEEVKVKILAKKDITPIPKTVRTAILPRGGSNGTPPVRRRVIISNGAAGRVVNLAEASQTLAPEKEEEESVSAIQSFLEQTSTSSKNPLDEVKVPSGIKITAAGKGVVNIRAVAESRPVIHSSSTANTPTTTTTATHSLSSETPKAAPLGESEKSKEEPSSSSSIALKQEEPLVKEEHHILVEKSEEAPPIVEQESVATKLELNAEALLQLSASTEAASSSEEVNTPAKKKQRLNSSGESSSEGGGAPSAASLSTPPMVALDNSLDNSIDNDSNNARSKRKRKEKKIFDL
eukprot:TRINITY_DN5271_c0_g1_i1.p1 TRINITY_DN5271_c0_g1~~TRINITY_DN5271_c0_g1_i1.p1  ORF type:complete len:1348 (-),score=509.64 TRINITY_DN5271_c0_g1_i1:500-4543(-)